MTNNIKTILNLLPLSLVAATAAAAEPQKNIVLILADDLGWADTTLYGKTSLYETPNIQRLAARGMTLPMRTPIRFVRRPVPASCLARMPQGMA